MHLSEMLHDKPVFAALVSAQTRETRVDPLRAEIVPNVSAQWHVIVTHPSHENIAASHLIGRGFGVYLPEINREYVVKGKKKVRSWPMFPTYLFAFVWDVRRHKHRVESCTGVSRVLCSEFERPAVVPDWVISDLQAVEFTQLTKLPRSRMRGRKRSLPPGLEGLRGEEIVKISTRSYFEDAAKLDDAARTSLLHRALGLTS